jgi:hypothetical protein
MIKERIKERKWLTQGEIRRSVVFVARWLITLFHAQYDESAGVIVSSSSEELRRVEQRSYQSMEHRVREPWFVA